MSGEDEENERIRKQKKKVKRRIKVERNYSKDVNKKNGA